MSPPPLSTRGRSANRQCLERNAWCTPAQSRYFVSYTSFGIGCDHSCRRYVRNTLRNRLVVWSTAISTYLCLYSLSPSLLAQMYDFTPMIFTVPMWGSEVAYSKTEIHLTNTTSEVMWACNVTTTIYMYSRDAYQGFLYYCG